MKEEISMSEINRNKTKLKNFDIEQIPPDLRIARLHYHCNKIGHKLKNHFLLKRKNMTDKILCPCCLKEDKKLYSLFTSPIKVKNWGNSIPIYFSMIYYILGFYVLMGLFDFRRNYQLSQLYLKYLVSIKQKPFLFSHFFFKFKAGFIKHQYQHMALVFYESRWYILARLIVCFIYIVYFYYSLYKMRENFEEDGNVSASKFTVMVGGVSSQDSFKQIIEYVQNKLKIKGLPPVEVAEVSKGNFKGNIYFCKKSIKIINKEVDQLKEVMRNNKEDIGLKEEKMINKMIERKNKQKKKFEKMEMKLAKKSTGMKTGDDNLVAFLTFQTIEMKKDVLKTRERRKCGWLCFKKTKPEPFKILKPPEPENVIWENIGYSRYERQKCIFWTFILSIFLLYLLITQLLFIEYLKEEIMNLKYLTRILKDIIKVTFFPMILKLAKLIIMKADEYTISLRKHLDATRKSLRITNAKINVSILSYVAFYFALRFDQLNKNKSREQKQKIQSSILEELVNVFTVNCMVSLFMSSGIKKFILKYFKIKKIEYSSKNNKKFNSKYHLLSQKELNEKFSPIDWQYEISYSEQFKTIYLLVYINGFFPSIIYLYIFYLLIKIQIDKYLFYKLYKQPPMNTNYINEKITFRVMRCLLAHLAYQTGSEFLNVLIYAKKISNYTNAYYFCLALTGAIAILLPHAIEFLVKVVLKFNRHRDTPLTIKQKFLDAVRKAMVFSSKDNVKYDKVKHHLSTDYKRENPMVRDQAMRDWRESALDIVYGDSLF